MKRLRNLFPKNDDPFDTWLELILMYVAAAVTFLAIVVLVDKLGG